MDPLDYTMPKQIVRPSNPNVPPLPPPRAQKEGETWLQNLKPCSTFNTVEDFWSLFNNILPASRLGTGCNYHLFKKGVMPMWEDKKNEHGGKWIITIPKQDRQKGKVDEWWLYTVLAMIGETMDETGLEVCGAVACYISQTVNATE
jgi:translation initiation factor 4E